MARVLAPGGRVMIYVWAMEKNHRHFDKQDVFIPWNRALCSQLLAEPAPSGWQPAAAPEGPRHQPACSVCGYPVCVQKRRASRRAHSLDGSGAPSCCGKLVELREEDSGFYSVLGRSFRSWFFSRSLDECTLKKQVEKPGHAAEEWTPRRPVSVQPSKLRHGDPDREPLTKGQDGAVEPRLTRAAEGQSAPGEPTLPRKAHKDIATQQQAGCFPREAREEQSCRSACPAGMEKPAAEPLWRRTFPQPPSISLASAMPAALSQAEALGSEAFTRYYHVFREGELCHLLEKHVPELHILSSINDHGNWCVIAEKKPGLMAR
ncbi:probable tRNA methyltransferase 9B [Gracilinanus agilis]|uniref:probable tRNA methyltransferase 9B n=1 Tax=Gracilinanus agilis TaxID=191870 RepID=UPI001CFC9488|nr:probable tRNA methyltransferase 9B [Gracilinanus agilis]